jgi:hypothetical protein
MVLAGEHDALCIARRHNRTIHDIQACRSRGDLRALSPLATRWSLPFLLAFASDATFRESVYGSAQVLERYSPHPFKARQS